MANNTTPKIIMAKLLQLNRPSKCVSNIVRTWWAMRSQKRRRERSTATAPTPPVPVIVTANPAWEGSEPGMYDVTIEWTIDHGSFPVASVEVFVRENGGPEQSLGTTPSSDLGFNHPRATGGDVTLSYRARYVFEDFGGPVIGAFSQVFEIYVPPEGG